MPADHLTQTQAVQLRAILELVLEANRALRDVDALIADCRIPGLSFAHLNDGQLGLGLFTVDALERLHR